MALVDAGWREKRASQVLHDSFRHAANQCDAGVESSCFQETRTQTRTLTVFFPLLLSLSFSSFFSFFPLLYLLHPRRRGKEERRLVTMVGHDGCVFLGCSSIGIT